MGFAMTLRSDEQKLAPLIVRTHAARGAVIMNANVRPMLKASFDHKWTQQFAVECLHRHLDVDDVLGGKTRHRGGANVVDTQSERAEALAQAPRDGCKVARPVW